jgi:hypothetical protein
MSELSKEDIIEAQRIIVEDMSNNAQAYKEDGKAWGSELL